MKAVVTACRLNVLSSSQVVYTTEGSIWNIQVSNNYLKQLQQEWSIFDTPHTNGCLFPTLTRTNVLTHLVLQKTLSMTSLKEKVL